MAAALLGTGARRQTVTFIGWFGPRGLASIVFAVILLDDTDLPHVHQMLIAIAIIGWIAVARCGQDKVVRDTKPRLILNYLRVVPSGTVGDGSRLVIGADSVSFIYQLPGTNNSAYGIVKANSGSFEGHLEAPGPQCFYNTKLPLKRFG